MDLIHKTCKNNFTMLWFQVNSLGVSLNWTAPSSINHLRSYSLLLREYCGSMVNLKLPSNTTRLAGAISSGCSWLKHYRYENPTTWLDNHRSMSTRRLQRYHRHVRKPNTVPFSQIMYQTSTSTKQGIGYNKEFPRCVHGSAVVLHHSHEKTLAPERDITEILVVY